MITQVITHDDSMPGSSRAGAILKKLVEHIVEDVPWVSLQSVTSDTDAVYDCILEYTYDSTVTTRIYNASATSSAAYVIPILNGEPIAIDTSNSYISIPYSNVTSHLITKVLLSETGAVIFWGSSSSSLTYRNRLFVGEVKNIYDAHTQYVFLQNCYITTSGERIGYAKTAGELMSIVYAQLAGAQPRGEWENEGTPWAAIPVVVYTTSNAVHPVCGKFGGDDTLYTIFYNNAETPAINGSVTINGHEFYTIPSYSNFLLAVRLS